MRIVRALLYSFGTLVALRSQLTWAQESNSRALDVTNPEFSRRVQRQREAALEGKMRLRGEVRFSDGSVPQTPVEITVICPAFRRLMAIANARGKFSFSFDVHRESDRELAAAGCVLRANLPGYRSAAKSIADLIHSSQMTFGKIVLEPITGDVGGYVSSDRNVSVGQKRLLARALNRVSRQDDQAAIQILTELVSTNRDYSSAWLTLGMVQESQGLTGEAEKSYLESSRADPHWAAPLIRLAALEISRTNTKPGLIHSQAAIALNPRAFPEAYLLSARAYMHLGDLKAAGQSAEAGIDLYPNHEYPDLEYILGTVFYIEGDRKQARDHLHRYLEESPSGLNVSEAARKLAQMEKVVRVMGGSRPDVKYRNAGPAASKESADRAAWNELKAYNKPLLTNLSALTCVESITTVKIDPQDEATVLPPTQVEVALTEGKEMYAPLEGKHFSERTEGAILNHSFSTTGIFSSVARSLVNSDQMAIKPKGSARLGRELLTQYEFHSLDGSGEWKISYNGQAETAAEEGWFLVDGNRLLRRVSVSALDIPENLKLIGLRATIDYGTETIAGRRVLLPNAARIDATEQSGVRHTSFISFHHWRVFAADSVLEFSDVSSGAAMNRTAQPNRLASGLELVVALSSPISRGAAQNNDLVGGTVLKPVVYLGRKVVESGAAVEGHLQCSLGDDRMLLELDRVQTVSGWAPVYGELTGLKSAGQLRIRVTSAADAINSAKESSLQSEVPQMSVPGVAILSPLADDSELLPGTPMVWRTVSPLAAMDGERAPQ